MKVLAFGEILWDIIEGVGHLGGAPFNFAAHAAQCGNEAYIISRLGTDDLGKEAFEKCKAYGVFNQLIQWDNQHKTGTVEVALKNGQPDYEIKENVAYDFISLEDVLGFIRREKFDLFYFGSLAQRNSVSADTLYAILEKSDFKHIFYDVNLRKKGYTDSVIKKSIAACSILKLNIDEVPIVSQIIWGTEFNGEDFCTRIKNQFHLIKAVVVTAAEKGCFVFSDTGFRHIPSTPVAVVDAVGAGDAFSAAFMHIFSKTGEAVLAAEIGNKLGGYVASNRGAIPVYSEEIKKTLKG